MFFKTLLCGFRAVIVEACLGESEIYESDVSKFVQHQILWFQISENDAVLVKELQCEVDFG